jgi:antitoxin (DNA-binding transcriptional repressor) of toxin-antitoxin stability system
MTTMTATEVARHFSEVLTRVEREGETIDVIRNGKLVAVISPFVHKPNGAEVLELLRNRPVDPEWAEDLASVREMPVQERPWDA